MFWRIFDNCKIEMSDRVSEAIEQYGYFKDFVTICLTRYRDQDWGDINRDLRRKNDKAAENSGIVIGKYDIPEDAENSLDLQLVIVAELDRSRIRLGFTEDWC